MVKRSCPDSQGLLTVFTFVMLGIKQYFLYSSPYARSPETVRVMRVVFFDGSEDNLFSGHRQNRLKFSDHLSDFLLSRNSLLQF